MRTVETCLKGSRHMCAKIVQWFEHVKDAFIEIRVRYGAYGEQSAECKYYFEDQAHARLRYVYLVPESPSVHRVRCIRR